MQDDNRRPGRTTAPSAPKKASGGLGGFLRETVIVVVTALFLSFLIKTFLAQAFYIPSESMQDTLDVNDRVMVSLLTPGPFDLARGDIVVFKDPGGWLDPALSADQGNGALRQVLTFVGVLPQDSGEHLIKRIIGLPGDHVVCCDAEQRITINGTPLQEDYLPPDTLASTVPFDVEVPEGRIWVMGDNRGFSQDSRYHMDLPGGGTVSEANVVGKALFLFWPVSHIGGLSNHPEVFDPVPAPNAG